MYSVDEIRLNQSIVLYSNSACKFCSVLEYSNRFNFDLPSLRDTIP